MFKFILALLLVSTSAIADEWTTADTKREAAYLTLHTLDWAQTRNIARNPNKWQEQNAILGKHPSISQVDRYFIATGALHFAVAYYLPAEYRKVFQYVTIGIEGRVVVHNFSIGIVAKF